MPRPGPHSLSGNPSLRIVTALVFLLASLALVHPATSQAQWSTESPSPTNLDVRGVGAPTADRVFLATADDPFDDGGALFFSPDGGGAWTQLEIPFSLGSPLNGIFFLDDQRGWTFGNDNYRTTDGGATWEELPFLGSTYFMRFYSADFGLATGNFGQMVSTDGGLSWVASPGGIFACDFADDLNGLGAADTGIYRTVDGGQTFAQALSGEALAVAQLSLTDAAAIVDSTFFWSPDGGQTWLAGQESSGRSRLAKVSGTVVLAHGRSGSFPDYDDRLLRSADGGKTWNDLGEVIPLGIHALIAADAASVVAVDRAGNLHHSGDGGQTWSQVYASPGIQPSAFSSAVPVFPDGVTGYYACGPGFVLRSTDGGQSWQQISSGSGANLNDVGRFAGGSLLAVGDGGTVLASNGGGTWVIHPAPTSHHLEAMQVVGTQDVVAVDAQGRAHRSQDGGATWTAGGTLPATGYAAKDLHFTSLQEGWVIGDGGSGPVLYRTLDGGETWTGVPGFQGYYVAVDFVGDSGWAASLGERFQRTLDGGETWIQAELPGFPFQISDMRFFDASVGYAVGWNGYAVRTADGGETWTQLPTPNNEDDLTALQLMGPDELWVATSSDRAWYSASGGQTWSVMDIGSDGFGQFAGITATAAGDAWLVGGQGHIEHFTGPPPAPLNQPPQAGFTFSALGMTVDFTDGSQDLDGTIVEWSWDFGDSTFSSVPDPSHTYEEADTYVVTLTVTDDDGDRDTAVAFVTVQPLPGGTFGGFTEVTPLDPLFLTPQDEDFWVATTAPADFDGDGDLDMAVLGYYVVYGTSVEERLVLLRNDGETAAGQWGFTYLDIPLGDLTTGASDMAWGDPDGDGDLDLAVGSDGQTVIYRNDGGVLVLTDTALPGYREDNDQGEFDLDSISWADFDNDGDSDLLLPSVLDTDSFTYRTALMRNDGPDGTGGWTFTETDSVFAATGHAQSHWADVDGDQDLDLLLVNQAPLTDGGFIRQYRNEGGGTFTAVDVLDSLSVERGEAQWGDYDSDGDHDILVVGTLRETDGTFTQALRIYRNDGGTHVPQEVIECIPCDGWFDLTAASWADYDSDGDVDILLTGTYNSGNQIEGRAVIFVNDQGVFSQVEDPLPAPRASGTRGGSFSWLDLDGEGDLDYFIAGEYFVPGGNGLIEAQMHVYRNDSDGQNQPPATVAGPGITALKAAGDFVLAWPPTTDDHTPAAALTYDLDIHRDGVPLTQPRPLPRPGNLGSVTQWTLTGLPPGNYTWSLRAVDSAFNAGSPTTGQFEVSDVSGAQPAADLPAVLTFGGNYPNPFNPATTFRFSVPVAAQVRLSIYDLKGRLVTHLVRGRHEPGRYEVTWEPEGLASGVYLARLEVGPRTLTRRVMLLK